MTKFKCELDQEELEDLLHGRREKVEFNFDDIRINVVRQK